MKQVPRKAYQERIGISNSRGLLEMGECDLNGNNVTCYVSKVDGHRVALTLNHMEFFIKG